MRLPPLPTGLITARLGEASMQLRENLATVSQEAVTGRRADVTLHLKGSVGDALLARQAVSDLSDERAHAQVRKGRLDTVQTALTSIRSAPSDVDSQLLAAIGRNDIGSVRSAASQARSALDSILAQLNTRHGERFVFAGTQTSTPPMASADQLFADLTAIVDASGNEADLASQLDQYFTTPGSGFQTSVYKGSDQRPDQDSVTALEPGIIALISGLAVTALAGGDSPGGLLSIESAALQDAAGQIATGRTALIGTQADLGTIERKLDDQLRQLDVEETLLTGALNALTGRDQYDAATELRNLEANLEAAYLLTSRLSSLSLLNFLR